MSYMCLAKLVLACLAKSQVVVPLKVSSAAFSDLVLLLAIAASLSHCS